jgi:4-hydroxybenzoate polyprenyltransferase/phosphoserine phosphatase
MRCSELTVFVDLDGTLIRSDLLFESLVAAVRGDWTVLVRLPFWLGRGRAHVKMELARRANINAAHLPYRDDVVEFLRSRRARGSAIVLATASDERLARQVAEYLKIFDDVVASNGQTNLKHQQKLSAIHQYCELHGIAQFAYVGDSTADLPIWEAAKERLAVCPSSAVMRRLNSHGGPDGTFSDENRTAGAILRAMRPHQWVKNVLVFLPMLMAHATASSVWLNALLAFVAFCLCASAAYVLNDLLDVGADRQHPKKRSRPFAAGDLPLIWGPPVAFGLLTAAFGTAFSISFAFAGVLFLYLIVTLTYSFWLKRKVMVDVLTLAGLYTLRIFAGSVATNVVVSDWLSAFSFFLFASLAFCKRYTELSLQSGEVTAGRGYLQSDLSLLETLGPTSGYISVLVLTLYINSEAVHQAYYRDWPLWLICALLMYWISRVWLHAKRQQLSEDPILFIFRDWVSLTICALTSVLWTIASWPPIRT